MHQATRDTQEPPSLPLALTNVPHVALGRSLPLCSPLAKRHAVGSAQRNWGGGRVGARNVHGGLITVHTHLALPLHPSLSSGCVRVPDGPGTSQNPGLSSAQAPWSGSVAAAGAHGSVHTASAGPQLRGAYAQALGQLKVRAQRKAPLPPESPPVSGTEWAGSQVQSLKPWGPSSTSLGSLVLSYQQGFHWDGPGAAQTVDAQGLVSLPVRPAQI